MWQVNCANSKPGWTYFKDGFDLCGDLGEQFQAVPRRFNMSKRRNAIYVLVIFGILILGGSLVSHFIPSHELTRVFPATIKRDCAPWDGAAFTVSIPYNSGSTIYISIWQSPDMKLPRIFTFPDEIGGNGSASYLIRFSYSTQLSGKVFFQSVFPDKTVKGWFDLVTEADQPLRGKFAAEWDDTQAYCG